MGHVTIVPVLIDPDKVKDPSHFSKENIAVYNLFLLGGNPNKTATKSLDLENSLYSSYRQIMIDLYCGLTPEEAMFLGNEHNLQTKTLKMSFQDKVGQARQLFVKHNGENWKEIAATVIGKIEKKLFRALQGVSEAETVIYLRKVGTTTEFRSVGREVEEAKKKEILKRSFIQITDVLDWEEAELVYSEYTSKLNDFLDANVTGRSLPTKFIEFCKKAKENLPAGPKVEVSMKVELKIDGEVHDNPLTNQIIDIYKGKLIKRKRKYPH